MSFLAQQLIETGPHLEMDFFGGVGQACAGNSNALPMTRQTPVNEDAERRKDFASVLLMEKMIREVYAHIQSKDIQPLQWSILRYLENTPSERCTVRWLTSFLGITHAPVVRSIATLSDKKLVKQSKSPSDARSHIISLTDAGRDALRNDPVLTIAQKVGQLPEDERVRFRESVRNLALSNTQVSD